MKLDSEKKIKRIYFFVIILYLSMFLPLVGQNLWQAGNPYNPVKQLAVGDIIRVIVDEKISSDFDLEVKREDNITIRIQPDKKVTDFLPDANSTKDYNQKKKGQNRNKTEIKTALSVLISEANNNGTFRVDGVKIISQDGQSSSLQIRGIIHPRDVNERFEINSSRIANLALTLQGDIVKKRYPLNALNQPTTGNQPNVGTQPNNTTQPANANTINQPTMLGQISEPERREMLRQYLEEMLGEFMDRRQ